MTNASRRPDPGVAILFSMLLATRMTAADTLPPGVVSQSDVDAICTEASVNKLDNTPTCVGFRRVVLTGGTTLYLMHLQRHTVTFSGKRDPASSASREVVSLEHVYIDDSPLQGAGTCSLEGDIRSKAQLVCDATASDPTHRLVFHVQFDSKGLAASR